MFEVWPENWRAFELFQGAQWTIIAVGMGGLSYIGIASVEIESVQRRLPPAADTEVPDERTLFRQIQQLCNEALPHLNQRG